MSAPRPSRGLPPQRLVQRELVRRSLAEFVKATWHLLEPGTPLDWNWHHDAVCDHVQALLEGRLALRNLVINVPPGTLKSRIVSVCAPAWRWIDWPEWRGIFVSGNPRVSLRDSMHCRTVVESEWYRAVVRPRWRLAEDQNAKGHYRNTAGGYRMAMGTSARITGDRGDGIFIDDPLEAQLAEQKAERDSVNLRYDFGLANRLNDLRTGVRCIIMQRLHENDLAGHVLAGTGWEHLYIPQLYDAARARATSLGWRDPRTTEGELLDPVRFPPAVIAAEKLRLGTAGFEAQHQQNPTPAGGLLIKRDWLRYYRTPAEQPAEIVKMLGITRIIQGWDTALTTKTTSDYTAGITLGVATSRYYVLDRYYEKVESPDAKRAIQAQHAKWQAHEVCVEGGGSHSGKANVQELRRDTRVPVIEIIKQLDKTAALNAVAPIFEAGAVYLPEDAPWVADFVENLCGFPKRAHDDDVDAGRIALERAARPGSGLGILDHYRAEAEALAATQRALAAASA